MRCGSSSPEMGEVGGKPGAAAAARAGLCAEVAAARAGSRVESEGQEQAVVASNGGGEIDWRRKKEVETKICA